jgi:hypothetical protein
MNLKKGIGKLFKGYIKEVEVEKVSTDDYLKPRVDNIMGIIIQNNENDLSFEKFNDVLSFLDKNRFIISGIIGTVIFAYKKNNSLNGDELNILGNNLIDKKILYFRKEVEFINCGSHGRYIYLPYFLAKNTLFVSFEKIGFNEILEIQF